MSSWNFLWNLKILNKILSECLKSFRVFIPETHLFSVQVQLVSFRDLSNSLILSECEWQLGLSWIGHKGLHLTIPEPLIWWHWHLSLQLDVMTEWLMENVWLSYWHKATKQNLKISSKYAKDRMKPDYLRKNKFKKSWDSGHFLKNGDRFKWGFFSKLFVFLIVDLNITVAVFVSKLNEEIIETKLNRGKVTVLKSQKQLLWFSAD